MLATGASPSELQIFVRQLGTAPEAERDGAAQGTQHLQSSLDL